MPSVFYFCFFCGSDKSISDYAIRFEFFVLLILDIWHVVRIFGCLKNQVKRTIYLFNLCSLQFMRILSPGEPKKFQLNSGLLVSPAAPEGSSAAFPIEGWVLKLWFYHHQHWLCCLYRQSSGTFKTGKSLSSCDYLLVNADFLVCHFPPWFKPIGIQVKPF